VKVVVNITNRNSLPIIALLVLTLGCAAQERRSAGIEQFVESRAGRESVWGVSIHLNSLSFRPSIGPDEIQIIDGKQGRGCRPVMAWSISHDRKCLRIRF